MDLLEEADLCIIEANYGDVLSDLEKRLIEEVRASRLLAEENETAADRVVELQKEVERLEECVEDLEKDVQSAQDDARLSREKGDEIQKEVEALEEKLEALRKVLG